LYWNPNPDRKLNTNLCVESLLLPAVEEKRRENGIGFSGDGSMMSWLSAIVGVGGSLDIYIDNVKGGILLYRF
jgi:hypothetical protein